MFVKLYSLELPVVDDALTAHFGDDDDGAAYLGSAATQTDALAHADGAGDG